LQSDDPLSQSSRCLLLFSSLTTYDTDPFLYYSIPEVHEATLSLREVDYSGILQSARMVKVTRKTRVSFEKPADDIVMDELFGGDESDGFEEASDLFVSLMSLYSNSSSTSRLNGSNL
jgi:hypothetical protein